MRCAVVVITLAAPRISQRTGPAAAARRRSARRRHGGLVGLHLVDDGARGGVGLRQAVEVAGQVLLDLALGLDDEAQAGAVAQPPGQQADAEGAGVPQRVEQAGRSPSSSRRCCVQARWSVSSRAACSSAGAAPGRARGQRLRLVQRLGADLADVVDPHQRAGLQ
jgi:hypothetical protein